MHAVPGRRRPHRRDVRGRTPEGGGCRSHALPALETELWETAEHEWRATVTALAEASLCGHGTGLAAFARSVMAHYGDEVEQCLG